MGHFTPIARHNSPLWWTILALGMRWAEEALSCPTECTCTGEEVGCAGKKLESFPATIPLTTKKLILAQNSLPDLPLLSLSYLNELVHLDCSQNLITMDPDFSFPALAKLTYLDLSFNNLTNITSFTFAQLSNLLLLNLSGNPQLVVIKRMAFLENRLLRFIDISGCGLSRLHAETFQELYSLSILGLHNNPWSCDCDFLTFFNWLTNTAIEFPGFENTTCNKPDKLHGHFISVAKRELHAICLQYLRVSDFIYICLITFCVFSGGILVAWLVGCATVMYYYPKMKQRDEPEDDEYRMI